MCVEDRQFKCKICKELTDTINMGRTQDVCELCEKYDEPSERGSTLS